MSWFYLSFVDDNLPTNNKFLGATVVEGDSPELAVSNATSRGLNPGGEVAVVRLHGFDPSDPPTENSIRFVNNFVPRDEVMAGGYLSREEMDEVEDVEIVCQSCNPRKSQ